MAWTKRDRVLSVLNSEIPDRVPVFECLINDRILEYYHGQPIAAGDYTAMVHACSGCLDVSHPILLPREPGEEILPDGSRRVQERWTTWRVPGGAVKQEDLVRQVKKQIEEALAYKPTEEDKSAYRTRAAHINSLSDMLIINFSAGVRILPNGDLKEESVYLFADNLNLVREWNRATNKALLSRFDYLIDGDLTPILIVFNDIAMKGRLLYTPDMLDELFYPTLEEMCRIAHSRGARVIFHSDGKVDQVMDSIVTCGIDGFNPLEISAGMDVRHFKERYGNKTALVGGLDAVDILAFGTVDQVIDATRRLLETAGKGGGLIAASSSGEIDNSMPFDNVMAYLETVWKYGKY